MALPFPLLLFTMDELWGLDPAGGHVRGRPGSRGSGCSSLHASVLLEFGVVTIVKVVDLGKE
jgi:hypothetical protein